jgi:DNA topoisomerase III
LETHVNRRAMKLVIAEKPSVARDLARVLGATSKRRSHFEGNGLQIAWCFGHMCELQEPAHYNKEWKRWSMEQLPMIPDRFDLRLRKDVKEHWKELETLLRSPKITEVVNACDAGREGELIFRYVYELAQCTHPISRLWVSSMTPEAIGTAWSKLRPGSDLEPLADAARCRSEADWLVGLNATRAMTCMVRKAGGDQLLSVGRVQTPTLAMIARRDEDIENFTPEPFWRVEATFSATGDGEEEAQWVGRYFRGAINAKKKRKDGQDAGNAERFSSKQDAEALASAVLGRTGEVSHAQRKRSKELPPLLYDLNSLQQRGNQLFGYSAKKTLDLAQALYERHKVLTYPRTDARYLTPDQESTIPGVLKGIAGMPPYKDCIESLLSKKLRKGKRIYNAEEVGDHHAILPTGRSPMSLNLNTDEKRIFDLVARRLLAALSPDALFDVTTLVVSVPPKEDAELPKGEKVPLRFRSRGKICVQKGWQTIDPPSSKKGDSLLPNVQKGDPAQVCATKVPEGKTRPPPHFNEASLLGAMERAGKELEDEELKRAMRNAGLGTAATRSSIIETLVSRGYIKRSKRNLLSTDRGRNLVASIPIEVLKSAEMTGTWEARLAMISEDKDSREAFMRDVKENLREVIAAIAGAAPPAPERIAASTSDAPSLGECPLCQTAVRQRGRIFTCDTGRSCNFVVFGTIASRSVSPTMVKDLLKKGRTKWLKGFKSKRTGKDFEASLKLSQEGRAVFDFTEGRPKPPTPVGMACPKCKEGRLIQGRAAWGCGRWREGCAFVFPFEQDGVRLRPEEAVKQLKGKSGDT